MKKFLLLSSSALIAVPLMTVVAPVPAFAQQITTEISGQVTDSNGAPLANATVTVTDTRTGSSYDYSTNEQGLFTARNLATGGPYTVTAVAPGHQGQTVNDITTTLQGATELTFTLTPAETADASAPIVVTAQRARVTQLETGPGTSFGAEVLETAPSFNRDVRDVIRIDPRVSLDRDDLSGQDRISCLGGNDRGNAFTVDGIAQSDVYGLNDTGFSARSSTPLPYDAIRETQVQFAPFDVEYGQFTGCAINVVTRGGSNKLRIGGFYEFTNDSLTGDQLAGEDFDPGETSDKRFGISIGGPIFKDRLFVFGAYEKHKATESQDDGPLGGGFANELRGVTAAEFEEVSQVIRDVYGIDNGGILRSLPFTNERWFLRGDLHVTDAHRIEATYQHLEESRISPDDFFTSQNSPQVSGANTALQSGSESDFYSARLFSQWADNISSELRYSRSNITDIQGPVGGGEAQSDDPTPRILVGVENDGVFGVVMAGPGNSRSANDLRTKIDQYKAALNVDVGNHSFKVGGELNRADIYNLFVQNATGTLVFRNISDLREGLLSPGSSTGTFPDQVNSGASAGAVINYTASGNVVDAAAEVKRSIYTLYAQDDWRLSDSTNIVAGLRYDWFAGGHPKANPNFLARYNFSNDTGFDDVDGIFLPRLAINHDFADFSVFTRSKVRAGIGMFSGGDPVVWFGNAFQNNGMAFAQATSRATGCPPGQIDVVVGGQFTGIPTCVTNAASATAALGEGNTQAIDPDIKMPTVFRANLGIETTLNFQPDGFFSGWRVNADYIYSRYRDPLTIVDLAQAINPAVGRGGYTIDRRPIYRQIDLTRAGCTGDLVDPGAPPVYSNLNAACFGGSRVDELLLTNAAGYETHIGSLLVSKNFSRGIFTPGGNVYFSAGYAYTDAQDRRNMFNSTAGSNYDNVAAFDRQDPGVSRGFYSQKHNITLSTTFREQFFKELDTTFGFTFVARSGRPYSLTYTGGGIFNAAASGSDNALLYIPTGVNDPNLSPLSNPAAVQQLVNFLQTIDCDNGYEGRTIKRNTCENDWFYDMDLRFAQQLPGPARLMGKNDTIEVYAMVDNFLNLLDSNWNIFRRRQFSGFQDLAQLDTTSGRTGFDSEGRYIVRTFTGGTFEEDNAIKTSSSLWRLKVGVSYKF